VLQIRLGAKAALILGVQFRALETRAEDGWGLRGSTLESALEEDAARGVVPFILIATLGSTSSGAIDNIAEITQVGERPD
jgi:aromatic-L-amino-acid decarboxylase